MILYKVKDHVNLKKISLLVAAGIVPTPLGANLLINMDEKILKIGVGIIVTISAIAFQFGLKIKIKNEKVAYVPVGILSGLLNGSVSLSGPPIILFLTNQDVPKQEFRATLTANFWILNIITIITFFFKGIIGTEVLRFTAYLLPALILGVVLGIKLGNKVEDDTFKKLTTVLIISMGILSVISGIK